MDVNSPTDSSTIITLNKSSAMKLVQSLVGNKENCILIPRLILTLCRGDFPSAILLSQCIYWQGKTDGKKCGTEDGYFWVSMKDWELQIGLSEYQIRNATKKIEDMNLLLTTKRKAWSSTSKEKVPTVHYQVNMDNLLKSLLSLVSSESIPEEIHNQSGNNCGNTPPKNQHRPRVSNSTETTPKITSNTTTATEKVVVEMLSLIPENYRSQKIIHDMIASQLVKTGFEYVKRNILYSNQHSNQPGKYRAYLGKAFKEDYAAGDSVDAETDEATKKWQPRPGQKFQETDTGLVLNVDENGIINHPHGGILPIGMLSDGWKKGFYKEASQ